MTRKVKIVATVGPASQTEETLEKLILAGMNVARMNFSHGTHEEHATRIGLIRKVSERLHVSVGNLQVAGTEDPRGRVGGSASTFGRGAGLPLRDRIHASRVWRAKDPR